MSLYVQIHSESDPSHVEDADDLHGTTHQKKPVVEPGQDAVPSQGLEVTTGTVRCETVLIPKAIGVFHDCDRHAVSPSKSLVG